MPHQPKLSKKKVGNLVYWFTKAGGETYFGNVDEVPFKEARRLFSDHVKNLLESDRASKGRGLTAGQLMNLFLEGHEETKRADVEGRLHNRIQPPAWPRPAAALIPPKKTFWLPERIELPVRGADI